MATDPSSLYKFDFGLTDDPNPSPLMSAVLSKRLEDERQKREDDRLLASRQPSIGNVFGGGLGNFLDAATNAYGSPQDVNNRQQLGNSLDSATVPIRAAGSMASDFLGQAPKAVNTATGILTDRLDNNQLVDPSKGNEAGQLLFNTLQNTVEGNPYNVQGTPALKRVDESSPWKPAARFLQQGGENAGGMAADPNMWALPGHKAIGAAFAPGMISGLYNSSQKENKTPEDYADMVTNALMLGAIAHHALGGGGVAEGHDLRLDPGTDRLPTPTPDADKEVSGFPSLPENADLSQAGGVVPQESQAPWEENTGVSLSDNHNPVDLEQNQKRNQTTLREALPSFGENEVGAAGDVAGVKEGLRQKGMLPSVEEEKSPGLWDDLGGRPKALEEELNKTGNPGDDPWSKLANEARAAQGVDRRGQRLSDPNRVQDLPPRENTADFKQRLLDAKDSQNQDALDDLNRHPAVSHELDRIGDEYGATNPKLEGEGYYHNVFSTDNPDVMLRISSKPYAKGEKINPWPASDNVIQPLESKVVGGKQIDVVPRVEKIEPTGKQMGALQESLLKEGYKLIDPYGSGGNVTVIDGKAKVVDPGAVAPIDVASKYEKYKNVQVPPKTPGESAGMALARKQKFDAITGMQANLRRRNVLFDTLGERNSERGSVTIGGDKNSPWAEEGPFAQKAGEGSIKPEGEKNAPPDRRLKVSRGMNGQVAIEFNDPMDKELFSATGRSRRNMMEESKGRDPNWKGLADHYGVPVEQIGELANNFKKSVMSSVKGIPEESTYKAPVVPSKPMKAEPISSAPEFSQTPMSASAKRKAGMQESKPIEVHDLFDPETGEDLSKGNKTFEGLRAEALKGIEENRPKASEVAPRQASAPLPTAEPQAEAGERLPTAPGGKGSGKPPGKPPAPKEFKPEGIYPKKSGAPADDYVGQNSPVIHKLADLSGAAMRNVMTTGVPGRPALSPHGLSVIARAGLTSDYGKDLPTAVKYGIFPEKAQDYIDANRGQIERLTGGTKEAPTSGTLKMSGSMEEPKSSEGAPTTKWQSLKEVHAALFKKPLLEKMVPALKISRALELEKYYKSKGLSPDAALHQATEEANVSYGGLNKVGRSQTAIDISRIMLGAPDWLESHAMIAKGSAEALLNPKNPIGKSYRNFMMNYAAYTALKVAGGVGLSIAAMSKKPTGHELDIPAGSVKEDSGKVKDRYLRPEANSADAVRIPVEAAMILAGDATTAEKNQKLLQLIDGRSSPIAKFTFHMGANQDYFGNPIYNRGKIKNVKDPIGNIVHEMSQDFLPGFVTGAWDMAKGKIGKEELATKSLGLPVSYLKHTGSNFSGLSGNPYAPINLGGVQ